MIRAKVGFIDHTWKSSRGSTKNLNLNSFNIGMLAHTTSSSSSSSFNYQLQRLYSTRNKNPFEDQVELWNQFADYYNKSVKRNQPEVGVEISLDDELSHLDRETNLPKQVDISDKEIKQEARVARASGYIQLNQKAFEALVTNKLKKGNALIVAQLAGIQASKQTAHLIPLCHQLLLDVCEVSLRADEPTRQVRCEAMCKASASSKTGVEMEALTACSVALLTVYDMCKAVQKDAVICDIRLESKSGGKSNFKRDDTIPRDKI